MPLQYIEGWEQQFIINKDVINDILLLRNRIYAHTDNVFIDHNEIHITFNQIKTLLDLADNIIKSIYYLLFDTEFDSTSPTFDKERFLLLNLMVRGQNQKQKELLDKARNMIDGIYEKL